MATRSILGASFVFFEIGVLVFVFMSMNMSLTWPLARISITLFTFITTCFFLFVQKRGVFKVTTSGINLCMFLGILCLYQLSFCVQFNLDSISRYICTFLVGSVIIVSTLKIKIKLLEIFSKSLGILLSVSLVGWVLFLSGVPLPHYTTYDGVFYTHTNYYFFLSDGYTEELVPRFMGMFQEPGHLGTTCVFLLFVNRFNLKRWDCMIMFISILFSLSLAAYGLLIGGMILHMLIYSRHKIIYTTLLVTVLAGSAIFAISVDRGDNVVNQMIVSRLEITDDGDIAGNNRYAEFFRYRYSRFIESKDRYFGIGNMYENLARRWWNNSAGWRRLLVTNGIVGTVLVLLFYIFVLRKNYSRAGLALFILYVVANMIRDHVMKEYWLYIYLMAIPILAAYTANKKGTLNG